MKKILQNKVLNAVFVFLLLLDFGNIKAQTSTQNFGTGTGSQTSSTGSAGFIPPPTGSGTTWARGGAVVPNGPIVLATASNPLGTSGTYVRAVASSSTSVAKFSPMVGYTGSTEFYTSFKVLFGDASAGTTATTGSWNFYQGAGTMYSDATDFTGAQVFAGLRFTYGTSGTLALTTRQGASFVNTGLSPSTFSQGTVYTIEIIGNNKTSGTINYNYSGNARSVAVQKYDLYINGTLVGDDIAEAALPSNTSIASTTFIGISSTSNVANVFVDDVVVYNAVPAAIGVSPANAPNAPVVSNPQTNALDVAIDTNAQNGNGAAIEYAIQETGSSQYVQANGTLGASAAWQTASAWGTKTVTGLTSNTTYTFKLKARNAANVETAFGATASGTTLPSLSANLTLGSALTAYGNVCTNATASNSFSFDGSNLDGSDVTIGALSGFSYSLTQNGTYTSTLPISYAGSSISGQVVWVQFSPTAVQSYNGNIPLTGGGLASAFNVAATGSGVNTPVVVTTGSASGTTSASSVLAGSLVSGCSSISDYGVAYSTSSGFGSGTQVSASNLLSGAFSTTISSLTANTTYYYKAYATDGAGTAYGTEQSFTTSDLDAPVAITATGILADGFTANWNPVTGAANYRLDVSTDSNFIAAVATNVAGWSFVTYGLASDAGNADNTGANSKTLSTMGGASAPASVGSGATLAATATGWDNGSGTKYWQVADVNTTGMYGLTLSSDQQSSTSGPKDFKIQYKIGSGGTWTDVSGGTFTVASSSSLTSLTDLALPAACENQSSVYLRWIMTSNLRFDQSTPGAIVASTGTSRLSHIFVKGKAGMFVSGYQNLFVSGTSQAVTGLAELTNYYYRVRTESPSSTSSNSNVITVQTANAAPTFDAISQVVAVVCDGADATFNVTGLLPNITSEISFNINGGATQTVNVSAGPGGFGTFDWTLNYSDNAHLLTVTAVDRTDSPGSPISPSINNTVTLSVNPNVTYYLDSDSDGFGNPALSGISCDGAPAGYVSNNTDCNDSDNTKHASFDFYIDADNDGYGTGSPQNICAANATTPPSGYSVNNTDCDDTKAAVHPGAVEIGYNGIDDNCDGQIDEGFPPKVTVIQSAMCNTTLAAIDSPLTANLVAGAQGYRWRITTMTGTNAGQVQFLDTQLRTMKITQLVSYAFATQYKVEVAVYYAGFLQPFTTSGCTVSTPSATTQLTNCGQSLTVMSDVVYANIVPFATGYRFRITDPVNSLNTQEIERSIREFRMNLVTSFAVQYGKTYNIEVAVRNTDGSYMAYGSACQVSTPLFPTTSLQDAQCDNYAVPSNTTQIYAVSYAGAIAYGFQLTGPGLPVAGVEVVKQLRVFSLNDFAGLIAGASYNVKVRLIFNLTDPAGPYGKTCTIVTPGASRGETPAVKFNAVAYPNPFAENFNIDVTTSAEDNISVKVYDMTGRLLESREVKVSDMDSVKVGDSYPSGVYNVIVSQGGNVRTLRVIKR